MPEPRFRTFARRLLRRLVLPTGQGHPLRREDGLGATLRPPRPRRPTVLRRVDPTPGDGPPPAA